MSRQGKQTSRLLQLLPWHQRPTPIDSKHYTMWLQCGRQGTLCSPLCTTGSCALCLRRWFAVVNNYSRTHFFVFLNRRWVAALGTSPLQPRFWLGGNCEETLNAHIEGPRYGAEKAGFVLFLYFVECSVLEVLIRWRYINHVCAGGVCRVTDLAP